MSRVRTPGKVLITASIKLMPKYLVNKKLEKIDENHGNRSSKTWIFYTLSLKLISSSFRFRS